MSEINGLFAAFFPPFLDPPDSSPKARGPSEIEVVDEFESEPSLLGGSLKLENDDEVM